MNPRGRRRRLSRGTRSSHTVSPCYYLVLVVLLSATVKASGAPFRSLGQEEGGTRRRLLPVSSVRRFSRARIDAPLLDDGEFFSVRFRDDGWTPQDLTVRSPEFATRDTPTDTSPFTPNSILRRPELQLHLDESTTAVRPTPAVPPPLSTHYKKTGTTIAGCICQGHVILAADTRATQNTIVADKNAQKLHPLAQNAWCAGAGTSADLEMVTRLCLYSMALEQLRAHSIGNRRSDENENGSGNDNPLSILYTTPTKEEDGNSLLVGRVSLAQVCSFLLEKLWKGQGNLGVNLILGCVDRHKAYLRALHPHGSMDVDLPFAALGSGGLAAMSILERGFHPNLTVTEATELVQAAIVAGIQNDLGSGSQVDLCIIAPDGTSQLTRCVVPSQVLEGIDPPPMDIPLPAEDSAGTNGFGNSPFRIKSRRVLVRTIQENDIEERATLLGL